MISIIRPRTIPSPQTHFFFTENCSGAYNLHNNLNTTYGDLRRFYDNSDYKDIDEKEWLRCRLLSFYDSSYYDDVIHKKPVYDNELIDLVAEEDGHIVGFIEIEIEKNCK